MGASGRHQTLNSRLRVRRRKKRALTEHKRKVLRTKLIKGGEKIKSFNGLRPGARSLSYRQEELDLLICKHEFNLLGITETRCKE